MHSTLYVSCLIYVVRSEKTDENIKMLELNERKVIEIMNVCFIILSMTK